MPDNNPVITEGEDNPERERKCPVGAHGRTNQDWWPNQLDLSVLHHHSHLSNPLEEDFNYAERLKSLDLDALKTGYGIGTRFHTATAIPLRIDAARGDEGFRVHVSGGLGF